MEVPPYSDENESEEAMKHSQAAEIIKTLLPALQKFKSNAKEAIEQLEPDAKERHIDMALDGLYPWLFDKDKNILPALSMMTDRLEQGGKITPQEFYNIMFIIHRWLPTTIIYINHCWNIEVPEPELGWMRGWEEE